MSKITRQYVIVLAVSHYHYEQMDAAIEWISATNKPDTWSRWSFFFAGYWCEQIQVDTQSQQARINLYANLCNIESYNSVSEFELKNPNRYPFDDSMQNET